MWIEPTARQREGNELIVFDLAEPERELERLAFPSSPGTTASASLTFFCQRESGEPDVVALQGVTVGPEVTELIERREHEGEFAESSSTLTALAYRRRKGLAEWRHSQMRRQLTILLGQGRRYSWGYPACPDQSKHEKVWRPLGLEQIGNVEVLGQKKPPSVLTNFELAVSRLNSYWCLTEGRTFGVQRFRITVDAVKADIRAVE